MASNILCDKCGKFVEANKGTGRARPHFWCLTPEKKFRVTLEALLPGDLFRIVEVNDIAKKVYEKAKELTQQLWDERIPPAVYHNQIAQLNVLYRNKIADYRSDLQVRSAPLSPRMAAANNQTDSAPASPQADDWERPAVCMPLPHRGISTPRLFDDRVVDVLPSENRRVGRQRGSLWNEVEMVRGILAFNFPEESQEFFVAATPWVGKFLRGKVCESTYREEVAQLRMLFHA